MIIGHNDPDKFLYHYTKIDTARHHILPKRSLMIGRYTNTDDPKENKDWTFVLCAQRSETLENARLSSLSKTFCNALKARTKVACFCRDSPPLTGDHLQDLSRRGFAKTRMWAHRGQRHSGVCLVFRKTALQERIKSQVTQSATVVGGDVSYIDRYLLTINDELPFTINLDQLGSIGLASYLSMHVGKFGRELFFEKALDWRDENEFRFAVFSNAEDDLFVEYGESLEGVIFGESAVQEDIDAVLKLAPLSTDVMGLVCKNGRLWYDFGNLRYDRDFRQENGLYRPDVSEPPSCSGQNENQSLRS